MTYRFLSNQKYSSDAVFNNDSAELMVSDFNSWEGGCEGSQAPSPRAAGSRRSHRDVCLQASAGEGFRFRLVLSSGFAIQQSTSVDKDIAIFFFQRNMWLVFNLLVKFLLDSSVALSYMPATYFDDIHLPISIWF